MRRAGCAQAAGAFHLVRRAGGNPSTRCATSLRSSKVARMSAGARPLSNRSSPSPTTSVGADATDSRRMPRFARPMSNPRSRSPRSSTRVTTSRRVRRRRTVTAARRSLRRSAQRNQGYLDAAPDGIDARWAWPHRGRGHRFRRPRARLDTQPRRPRRCRHHDHLGREPGFHGTARPCSVRSSRSTTRAAASASRRRHGPRGVAVAHVDDVQHGGSDLSAAER